MDTTTNEKVNEALALLAETGVRFLLQVDDVHAGIAVYSNGMTDRLYYVNLEETSK